MDILKLYNHIICYWTIKKMYCTKIVYMIFCIISLNYMKVLIVRIFLIAIQNSENSQIHHFFEPAVIFWFTKFGLKTRSNYDASTILITCFLSVIEIR